MKKLKLDHILAEMVVKGGIRTTWRLFDDKDISVNDAVELIDKVDPEEPRTWRAIGVATVNKIIEKRLSDVTKDDMGGHEKFSSRKLLATYRKYYGPNVTQDSAVKILFFDFEPRPKSALVDEGALPLAIDNLETIKIYADGGSRGNPGPSASGFVIMDQEGLVLVNKGIYLGITTNNQAEYQALKFALEEAQKMHVHVVEVYMDSMLVINQMKGIFKIKNRDLWPIHEAIKRLVDAFQSVTFYQVPRELNNLADAAVNRALDEALGIIQ